MRARFVPCTLVLGAVGAASLTSGWAQAQGTSQDVATAQALFDEGKRLMEARKLDDACPKLEESQRLDPAGGTLVILALCHEGQGKTATAWAELGIALGEARKDHRADREAAAVEHIRSLEPRLTRLRIVVAAKVDGLEIRRGGSKVGVPQWGTPLPVDPGDHAFEARAPNKKPWSKTVSVRGEGATVDVTIPPLEDDTFVIAPVVVPGTTPPLKPPPSHADEDAAAARSSRLTWAAIAGGTGLVLTGVGVAFGVSASSKWSDAERACPENHCTNAADKQLGKDAGSTADLSTVFFALGGVGLATGLVLWLTAPSGSSASSHQGVRVSPMVSRDSGGILVGGAL